MYKITLIIALLLAVFGIGGGSYYYFMTYEPRAYAASAISLYTTLETAGLQPDTSSLQSPADYAGAIKVLRERVILLESMQRGLSEHTAPKRMSNFHRAFADYIDFTLSQHTHAVSLALFLDAGRELREALKQIYAPNLEKDKMQTIGDVQQWWGERIPRVQALAETFFREDIAGLSDPSFAELRALWKEGSPAFDILLARIRSANPRLSLTQMGAILTSADVKRLEGHSKKLEEFLKKLDILLERYNAYDILAFRYFPDVSQTEASDRTLQFYQIMKELREMYLR